MIITEIYIENQRLDLYKDISAELTYNIDDVKDFASRNTNFSKTIILPGNATNNKVFGHIFEFGSGNLYNPSLANVGYNYNASKSAQCVIYIDKIQIFKGVLRLLEIVIDRGTIEYECAVFGELGGFISSVGNSKVEELDFSSYDCVWDKDTILNSWDNINGTGLYFPVIDYGQVSTNKHDWNYKAMRPAVYVAEIVDKIITNAGYTYDSEFFSSALFKRLVVPNNQKQLSNYVTDLFYGDIEPFTTSGGYNVLLSYLNTQTAGFTLSGDLYWNGANTNTNILINIDGWLYTPDNEHARLRLNIKKNGTTIAQQTLITDMGDFSFAIPYPLALVTGDYLSFELEPYDISTTCSYGVTSGNLTISTETSVIVPIDYGGTIFVNATLPRGIFQKDFFASIVKMFNLYVLEDSIRTKHLIIKPYIDFFNTDPMHLQVNALEEELLVNDDDFLLLNDSYQNAVDWTNKIDRSKPFRIKPMSELNGRYYEYKYKTDADFYNDQYQKKYTNSYGDIIEDTGFEFAKDKQTAEIIFSPTPIVGYSGQDKVYSTIFKMNNNIEEGIDSNIRILQAKKLTGYSNWNILDNIGSNISTQDFIGYAGHLDDPDNPMADINFGAPKELFYELTTQYPSANLFNGFWSDYVAEITDKDSKLLQCNVLLTNKDIYELNFADLIFIDNSLWRLNKVMDYNPMEYDTTKCEFLKVIEITYA